MTITGSSDMIHLSHLIDPEGLLDAVADGYVSARHDSEDLTIYNYTAKAVYEQRWDDVTRNCRGLVINGDGEVVSRPFAKFFNVSEHGPDSPHGKLPDFDAAVAREKVDGSLIILSRGKGDRPIVSTRGSFNSTQAIWAKKHLQTMAGTAFCPGPIKWGQTALFEGVYPQNRIVVDYNGAEELVLLAVLDNATGKNLTFHHHDLEAAAEELNCRPAGKPKDPPGPGMFIPSNREGWVLEWPDGTRAKVKSREYVELHRLLFGMTPKKVWEMLGETIDGDRIHTEVLEDRIALAPKEFREPVNAVADMLMTVISSRHDAAVKEHRRILQQLDGSAHPRDNRAAYAALATQWTGNDGESPALLFSLLDHKPIIEAIWKSTRPTSEASLYDPNGKFDQLAE